MPGPTTDHAVMMRLPPTLETIEARIEAIADPVRGAGRESGPGASAAAAELLRLGEEILECWLKAKHVAPTEAEKEGFRLLALHRQGAKGDPTFNACRETCRELAYHYNLITLEPEHQETEKRVKLMVMVAKHLCLFIEGKLQLAGLGEFCCSSRSIRGNCE
jgi:hypothetical protein